MYKSCPYCGRVHSTAYRCSRRPIRKYTSNAKERKLRSTYAWTEKAKQIKEQSKYLCAVCYDQGIYNYKNLEVHHIVKLSEDEDGLLDDENLICLCTFHHKQADAGEIKQSYLKDLARQRIEGKL